MQQADQLIGTDPKAVALLLDEVERGFIERFFEASRTVDALAGTLLTGPTRTATPASAPKSSPDAQA